MRKVKLNKVYVAKRSSGSSVCVYSNADGLNQGPMCPNGTRSWLGDWSFHNEFSEMPVNSIPYLMKNNAVQERLELKIGDNYFYV